MDGISTWLLLSLLVAAPCRPVLLGAVARTSPVQCFGQRTVHRTPQTVRSRAKKSPRRARAAGRRSRFVAATRQPATPGEQLQSKSVLPPLPKDYRAVAVWPIAFDDTDAETAAAFETAIADGIDGLPKHRAISPRDVETDLQAQGQSAARCDRDVVCMAHLGRLARAHRVLEIRLVPTGGITMLQARLLDTLAERTLRHLDEPLAQDTRLRGEQAVGLVTQLLEPAAYVGSLEVRCNAPGAHIFLDGNKIGEAPLPPIPRIGAGVHILRVVRRGHADLHRFIDVQFNMANIYVVHDTDDSLSFESVMQDAPLPAPPQRLDLAPPVPPHFPSWRTWSALGAASAGVVSLGASTYLAISLRGLNRAQRRDEAALAALQLGDPNSLQSLARLRALNVRGPRLERGQWATLGAGAGLLGLGAALFAWDLRLRRQARPSTRPQDTAADSANSAPVTLVPAFGARGLGLRLDVFF